LIRLSRLNAAGLRWPVRSALTGLQASSLTLLPADLSATPIRDELGLGLPYERREFRNFRFCLLARGIRRAILPGIPRAPGSEGSWLRPRAAPPNPAQHRVRDELKQAEEASFVDLIACERDCRTCSYAAALDCDGNCGVCPHNSYCPCVNPVVARSKSALRLIELRPILLQDLQARN
jgi:hypothetical protein